MSTSLLYHSQGIAGFQHVSYTYEGDNIIQRVVRGSIRCGCCGSADVTVTYLRRRRIQTAPSGRKKLYLEIDVHSVYCLNCKSRGAERLNFLSHPKARITKSLERTVIELRVHMSISAIAGYFGMDWRTVKDSEKRHLEKKYRHIRLRDVRVIGIDEIFVTRRKGVEKYITVVRDLESGAVLFVGRGKGADTLEKFGRRLKLSKCKIVNVAMDMGRPYISWAEKTLPEAEIVFDHFHVVKMMNDKLDGIRRRVARNIDEEQRKLLKNQRFLFLRNVHYRDVRKFFFKEPCGVYFFRPERKMRHILSSFDEVPQSFLELFELDVPGKNLPFFFDITHEVGKAALCLRQEIICGIEIADECSFEILPENFPDDFRGPAVLGMIEDS